MTRSLFLLTVLFFASSRPLLSLDGDSWQGDPSDRLHGFRNMYQPHVLEVPDPSFPYRMYFFGWADSLCNDGAPGCDAIFIARSADLREWEVYRGSGQWDPTMDPTVWEPVLTAGNTYWDQWHTGDPSVVLHEGLYYMIYTSTGFDIDGIPGGAPGDSDGNLSCLMGAVSVDGIHWSKSSAPLLIYPGDIGRREYWLPNGDPDLSYTGDFARPSLLREGDGWRLWFDYWLINYGGVCTAHARCDGNPMNPDDWTVTTDLSQPMIYNWPNPDVVAYEGVYYTFADPVGYPCDGQDPWTCRQRKGMVSADGLDWYPWEGFVDPDADTEACHVPELLVTRDGDTDLLTMFYSCQVGGDPYDYQYNRIRSTSREITPNDLYLLAEPRVANPGAPVTITTRFPPPLVPCALVVIDINGQPLFHLAAVGNAGANREWAIAGQVPPDLGPMSVTFRSYAALGQGVVGCSSRELLRIQ